MQSQAADRERTPVNVARPEPLYQQVSATLREQIASGIYPVGSTLPTVKQLAESFGVSLQTARDAVARLRVAGLVSTRRKGGTRVEAVHIDGSGHVMASIQQLLAYGESVRLQVQKKELVVARTDTAELLQCTPGEAWLKVSGYRQLGDDPRPRVYLEVFINQAYPRVFDKITARTKAIFRMFEEVYGLAIVEFRQEIRTVAITGAAAALLDVPVGTLGMRYVNRFIGQAGDVVEVSVNIHPLSDTSEDMLRRSVVAPKID